MSQPTISVILPVYNGADTLGTAIESVQRQSATCWELLIIDNGSKDNTIDIVNQLQRNDPRIRLSSIAQPNLVAALNLGLTKARGCYIARMDADDYCSPDRLARQKQFLEKFRDIDLVACCADYDGDQSAQAGYALYVKWSNSIITYSDILRNRFIESPIIHPTVCFRKEIPDKYGTWREGPFPEDYELWLRWLDCGVKMEKISTPLLQWNDHPQRLSRTNDRYSSSAFYRCKAEYLAKWLDRNVDQNRDIWVWGAGRTSRQRAQYLLEYGITITGWIDIDDKKCGKRVATRPVIKYDQLPAKHDCFVISYVGSRGGREKITSFLERRGFIIERDFIIAA